MPVLVKREGGGIKENELIRRRRRKFGLTNAHANHQAGTHAPHVVWLRFKSRELPQKDMGNHACSKLSGSNFPGRSIYIYIYEALKGGGGRDF